MPKVHRFLDVKDVRAQVLALADAGLHVGIDLSRTESLFGKDWDRDAREVGRRLRAEGRSAVVRGPGAADLPLGALDAYVADQVRACHDRAMTAAMHYGASAYVVRLANGYGVPRSERLARLDATAKMIGALVTAARSRGMEFFLEPFSEQDPDALDVLFDALSEHRGRMVFSPAFVKIAGYQDIDAALDRYRERIGAIDLTDRNERDLEPRAPGRGVLGGLDILSRLLQSEAHQFLVLDGPEAITAEAVESLNALAQQVAAHCA